MSFEKHEIIRQVNEKIEQIKNKTYQSPFHQAFAEVYIEDGTDEKKSESTDNRVSDETITNQPVDPKRQLFLQMRQLSRDVYKITLPGRTIREYIFYQQAKFMAEYEDDYQDFATCSMYYPNYQMMSYEQLRTYFTWRSGVRLGTVNQTDLSYVFIYIYELINNIGVTNGEDGIKKLLFLWGAYRQYSDKLDKYMAAWVKEYYILNECSFSFDELVQKEVLLQSFYLQSTDKYSLDFYSRLSAYKIKQSVFYTPENEKMLGECLTFVITKMNELLDGVNAKFEDLIYYKNSGYSWYPFTNAIYYPKPEHWPRSDKTVKISDEYEYRYQDGKWSYTQCGMLTENGRQIVGYLLKRMEQLLRKAAKFKYKLSADSKHIDKSAIDKTIPEIGSKGFFSGIDLAIKEYYINSKKTVVAVDKSNLDTIRRNALLTQEKLIVPEDYRSGMPKGERDEGFAAAKPTENNASSVADTFSTKQNQNKETAYVPEPSAIVSPTAQALSSWEKFIRSLDSVEALALQNILSGASVKAVNALSKENGLMLEVLIDGINQKAIDAVGDNILELSDEIIVYDEYTEQIRKAVESEYD